MLKKFINNPDAQIGIIICLAGIAFFGIGVAQKNETNALRKRLVAEERAWADHKKAIRADIETREGDRTYRVVSQHLRELGL
jgi:hypothetical protein